MFAAASLMCAIWWYGGLLSRLPQSLYDAAVPFPDGALLSLIKAGRKAFHLGSFVPLSARGFRVGLMMPFTGLHKSFTDAKAPGISVLFTWPSRGELSLTAYAYKRESANSSRYALEQLIEMLAANPNVKEINIVAHSMGNLVTLEALRGMASRRGKIGAKVRNVMLVAPDVGVDMFHREIQGMGKSRPRFLLFASQDDIALNFSKTIGGGVARIGAIDPAQEPYKSELAQENVEAFDLTKLKGNAHSRAFEDITTVVSMIKVGQ